ncbi:ATP-dependent DNA helicase RecG [Parvimonas micra]|uniref:ATP-dependent DNA helicase RecG n=1 Tax=Parvimonas micra TaxID=33033 RepID=A0A9X3HA44_9FIRM|nr:ATP-dependent DNA helicase RecG [Parvimonas micra]MCZ7406899.1 ATP-dependent DNA helicase RecG [Parvimonas micra]MCZ7409971.1 ATP-dependent DNA helicase RecG [Parvimonas micra]MCZ7411739.1 ATP-dependent DNA helicase RecG [Parvimonas micra]WBB37644.1 ATP-dependent DNA helicase RecG [Parvimonas micra]
MELKDIKGIGEKKIALLNKLGIFTVNNLLEYFPYSYIDTTKFKKISEITEEGSYSYRLKIISLMENRKKRNIRVTKFLAMDEEMNYCTIVYFNNIFISKNLKINNVYEMYGRAKLLGKNVEIQSPTMQNKANIIGSIIPQYHLCKGISNLDLVKIIQNLLKKNSYFEEKLPSNILNELNLESYDNAIRNIHFPKDNESFITAKRRLSFDEIFYFQLSMKKLKRNNEDAIRFEIKDETFDFIKSLSFKLTNSQNKVLDDIFKDMASDKQMNRLIQGDVGCGKTIISFIAMFNVIKNGFQSVLMAPTEILARQHYESSKKLFSKYNIKVELLVGSLKESEKKTIREKIENGDVDIIIGTHAVFQEKVVYKNLGFVITDEQHRFGVKQRLLLSKKSNNPDILVMSATPIPRTVGLVMFCDLDISTIDELPSGRGKINTYFVDENYEERYMNFIKKHISEGRQAYIVCPLVDESDTLELQSVINLYERLKERYFQDVEIEFIHGKIKPIDKDKIMKNFENGKIKVLVATTVIEVGINVPNSNIMVIYNAERFGLSQLHQLRGRIGRGNYESFCILVSNNKSTNVKKRMDIMCSSNDGFYISEQDFLLRGYGDILGYRQSGEARFKILNIQKDYELLKSAIKYVDEILKDDFNFDKEENQVVKRNIDEFIQNLSNNVIMN